MKNLKALYTKKVLEHFRHPKNQGRLKNPDGVGRVGNLICGDVQWLYIKVEKNKKGEEFIKDIKFETFGCVAAIATTSVITQLAKGKTIKEALAISKDTIVKKLGNLPKVKYHCSLLAVDGLREAIYDYLSKNKKRIPLELQKRHQKIEKETKFLEERNKKFLK